MGGDPAFPKEKERSREGGGGAARRRDEEKGGAGDEREEERQKKKKKKGVHRHTLEGRGRASQGVTGQLRLRRNHEATTRVGAAQGEAPGGGAAGAHGHHHDFAQTARKARQAGGGRCGIGGRSKEEKLP